MCIRDRGYELDKLTVKDASGNKLKLTDKGNGKYTSVSYTQLLPSHYNKNKHSFRGFISASGAMLILYQTKKAAQVNL